MLGERWLRHIAVWGSRGKRVGRRPSRRHRCFGEGEGSAIVVWEEEGSAIAVCVKWREARSLFRKGRRARSRCS